MNSSLKVLHDRLMAEKPEGAVHDIDSCPLCAMAKGAAENEGTGEMTTTFTEDEVTAKVAEAVKAATEPLETKLRDLHAAAATSESESAVAAIKADYETRLAAVNTDLDAKVLEAANATAERDALKAWLDAEAAAAEQAQVVAARREERLTKVKAVAAFPEEYLTKNAERFAAMSDDDFEAAVESWKALGTAPDGGIPSKTGLHAGREGMGAGGTSVSATKELFALRRSGGHVDLASL